MSDLERQVADGEKAAYAMEYLGDKFDRIESDLFELLAETNMHDNQTKDELLRSVKNLRRLRDLMTTDIANGELARKVIARSARDRLRNAIGW